MIWNCTVSHMTANSKLNGFYAEKLHPLVQPIVSSRCVSIQKKQYANIACFQPVAEYMANQISVHHSNSAALFQQCNISSQFFCDPFGIDDIIICTHR